MLTPDDLEAVTDEDLDQPVVPHCPHCLALVALPRVADESIQPGPPKQKENHIQAEQAIRLRNAVMEAKILQKEEELKPLFRKVQRLRLDKKALAQSGLIFLVKDETLWPKSLVHDRRGLLLTWRKLEGKITAKDVYRPFNGK